MESIVQYVEARRARFAVRSFGSGTPVLALHGGFRDAQVWIDVARAAALENVRVIAPDGRGHGLSSPTADPAAYGIPELARDAIAIADALGLSHVAIVGSSMGTRIAAHIAINAPERVASLGLSLPPPTSHEAQPLPFFRALAADIKAKGFDVAIEAMRRRNPLVAENMSRMPREALTASLSGMSGKDFDLTAEDLSRITCLTRVLGRKDDPGHLVETAEFYAANVPGASLKVVAFDEIDTAWGELLVWAARASTSG